MIFEQWAMRAALMRTNIPAFRLPESVLAEEIGYITGWAPRSATASASTAVEEGCADGGLRRGVRRLRRAEGQGVSVSGRREGDANIHIGIQWLSRSVFST